MNTRHILAVYHAATIDEKEHGARWYRDAAKEARALGLGLKTGAGILAALSPQCAWAENVRCAQRLVKNDYAKVNTRANRTKARKIKRGADPLDILGGNKVRSFYAAIVASGKCDEVCIDRHAVSIAIGQRLNVNELERVASRLRGQKFYRRISDMYRDVARTLSISPVELQAATWLAWRRLHNVNYV